MNQINTKGEKTSYETRDRRVIIMLAALGLKPLESTKDGNTIYISFPFEQAESIIDRYRSGEQIMVDISAVWRAEEWFKSLLNKR